MITRNLTIVCSLLVAAGCSSYHEKHARYGEPGSVSSYGTTAPAYSTSTTTSTATNSASITPGESSAVAAALNQAGTDTSIASKFKQSLSTDPALASIAPNIEVKGDNGTITLTGTVPSEREKQRIETLAQSLSGVSRVDNQLQVSLAPTSEGVGQTSRIYSNSTSQAAGTIPGQVNTEGLTPTSDRQDSNRVYSNDSFKVTVQGANETDQTLSQQIRSTLQKDPAIASLGSNVKISLENGKATLMGTVTDEDSKNKIESAIQQVSGVTSVDNQLQVNAGGTPPEQSK